MFEEFKTGLVFASEESYCIFSAHDASFDGKRKKLTLWVTMNYLCDYQALKNESKIKSQGNIGTSTCPLEQSWSMFLMK